MDKEKQLYDRLEKVYDPELDQPLTELGFIDHTTINEDKVEVVFRLPTYWCSPNFAYIMAEDIQKNVSEIDWVNDVQVNLIDHCNSDEINQGVNTGEKFRESLLGFSGSDGNLDDLRLIFRKKAFRTRQERVIRHLLGVGLNQETLLNMTVKELKEYPELSEEKASMERYFMIRSEFGHRLDDQDKAFVQENGKIIKDEEFSDYMLEARRTRMSMDFNTNYCAGLLRARYGIKDKEAEGIKS